MSHNKYRAWAADPHQYGPGKVHCVDVSDNSKTLCGRYVSAVPGKWSDTAKPTCRICLDAVVRRPEQERQRQEYERRRIEQEQERTVANAQWWAWYDSYLESSEWHAKRAKVFARAGNTCEGCGIARATQVHHTTYKHVGSEFLWELRAICEGCHTQLHDIDEKAKGQ